MCACIMFWIDLSQDAACNTMLQAKANDQKYSKSSLPKFPNSLLCCSGVLRLFGRGGRLKECKPTVDVHFIFIFVFCSSCISSVRPRRNSVFLVSGFIVWPGMYLKPKGKAYATVVTVFDAQNHTSLPGGNPGRGGNHTCRKNICSILGNKLTCSNMLLRIEFWYHIVYHIKWGNTTTVVICNTHSMIYCAWCRIEHDLVENKRHTVVTRSYYGRLHSTILHCTNTIHDTQLYTTKLCTKHCERILLYYDVDNTRESGTK